MDLGKITLYFNLGLIALFVSFALGVFFAILHGMRRGVWKSTYCLICLLTMIIIAFVTLDPLCKFAENFDISFFKTGSFYISRIVEGEKMTYYVPITSVKGTATEFLKGFYTIYNVSASASNATNFAFAIVESIIKLVLFLVDIILIMTLGRLFSFLSWIIAFKHFVPKLARKVVKVRWLGALETGLNYVISVFLLFMPLTSLVNSINQSYQRNRPNSDNEMIINIGNFVDAYNDSLFAKILFNWTVDEKGMTLDTKLLDTFTTGISEDVSIGLVGELANFTNLFIIGAAGITSTEEAQFTYDATQLISKEIVDSVFNVLAESDLLTTVLPLAVDIALNSSLLDGKIPNRLLDLSDVDWKHEIGYMQEMVDSLFDSGVMDALISTDENGRKSFRSFEGEGVVDFVESIIFNEDFENILNIFKTVDQSKLFCRVIPTVFYYLSQSDESGTIKQYMPLSWEELNEFSWGYECYILFDFLHKTVTMDRQFLRAIMAKVGAYTPQEGEEIKSLTTLLAEHIDDIVALIVGNFDEDGKPVNVDKTGRTIVFDKGERIEGRNYCLFDMMAIEKALPIVIDGLYSLDFMKEYQDGISENDRTMYHDAVAALNEGVRLANFKKEFHAILDIFATIAKDQPLVDAVVGGKGFESLITEPGNYFSIDKAHIDVFATAIRKMDNSSLLYSATVPIIKSFINQDVFTDFLKDVGLRNDVIVDAINKDALKEHHTFYDDFGSLLSHWSDLADIYSLTTSGGGEGLMDKFKDGKLVDALVSLLSEIYKNPIINPTPVPGDLYEKNENLYGLLEFVFGMTKDLGLTVTREKMREVETETHTWDDEFNAIGDIIKYIAGHDVLKASDMFKDGLTRTAVSNLKDDGEGQVGLPKLFSLIDKSYLFSSSLGSFLDDMFGDALSGFLVDKDSNVSFANISNWEQEGERIANLLESMINLIPADDAEAKDFLKNFDLSTLKDIVELNNTLHQLANSGIFTHVGDDGANYQFGIWFYGKIDSSMKKFTVGETDYDLLADPSPKTGDVWSWKDSWGIKPGTGIINADPYFEDYQEAYNPEGALTTTHYIAYRDFAQANGMATNDPNLPAFWCDYVNFTTKQAAFLAEHKADLTAADGRYINADNEWGAYFASDVFIADYDDVFAVDEISRVCKFMTYTLRVLEKRTQGPNAGQKLDFNNLPTALLRNMLTSLNNTYCLRISIYNFYDIAANNLLNGYSAFNLSGAYSTYMVDTNVANMFDFAASRVNRQNELDTLIHFYEVIDKAKKDGILVGSDFVYSKMTENGFVDAMRSAVKDFNNSYVFHRLGSSKVDGLSTFQELFNSMLSQSNMKDVIYLGENSPKDAALSSLYENGTAKIRYLVTTTFLSDQQIVDKGVDFDTQRSVQENEIDILMNSIDNVYSLKDKEGNKVSSMSNADLNNNDNIDTIENLFNDLNDSVLLYDCLPNSIYNIFVKDGQMSIKNGDDSVDFKRVDPFYHYYYLDTAKRMRCPDWEARYLPKDISGIVGLITDYQNFNSALAEKEISNPDVLHALSNNDGVLETLLMHMHDSNIFHTPARNYTVGAYYTNKFENTGFTLFEEMVNKVCSFVKLDDFAYDDAYAPDHAIGSAALKLTQRIKAITAGDDNGEGTLTYHNAQGVAWAGEVDSIVHLANVASGASEGSSLDVSTFKLDKLPPATVKDMLTAVNASDLVCDAIPKFVSDGFDSIKLGTLTSYSDVNYATYRLGQVVYGGSDASASDGTEINNIYNVMVSLYDGDKYLDGMDNFTEFVKTPAGENGLRGLIRYVYESHILNTNKNVDDGYNKYYVVESKNLTARGVLLVNALGDDLAKYIARDADKTTAVATKIEQISRMSELVHLDQYKNEEVKTYQVEAEGLIRLVKNSEGKINATSLSADKINTADFRENTKPAILGIVSASYNATNAAEKENYKRSAITSEFISGVMNNVLENEYSKLDNAVKYPGYVYTLFSFGNDVDNGVVELADYASMNETEYNGLDGMIDSLQYVANLKTLTPENRTKLKDNFAKMGETAGHNSKIAQPIYLVEAHSYFKLLGTVPNLRMEYFIPVDETNNDPAINNNVYSNTFSFKEYGERVEAFLS